MGRKFINSGWNPVQTDPYLGENFFFPHSLVFRHSYSTSQCVSCPRVAVEVGASGGRTAQKKNTTFCDSQNSHFSISYILTAALNKLWLRTQSCGYNSSGQCEDFLVPDSTPCSLTTPQPPCPTSPVSQPHSNPLISAS